MVELGFSIYPERYSLAECQAYIAFLHRYGARRLFMSLLQLETGSQAVFELYREVISYANQLGMMVVADVSPHFIKAQGWQDSLMDRVVEFGLAGIRLDEALALEDIIQMTQNPYGIKVELNLSTDKTLLTKLLTSPANLDNVIACHNFYPHAYTGLSQEHFLEMSSFYHQAGIKTAAFVTAQSATEGPWPLSEGLPTLEEHRHWPLSIQIAWLKATGWIDSILLSNQFVSEEELQSIQTVLREDKMRLEVDIEGGLTPVERAIMDFDHVYRGDRSAYVIRSTMPRLAYQEASIPARTSQQTVVQRGDILIDNDLYGRYKGELQIALREFTVDQRVNRVGRISPVYLSLLDFLKPWQEFKLCSNEDASFH